MWYIYVLRDPRDDAPRYVGKCSDPRSRLRHHKNERGSTHKTRWIQSLVEAGMCPRMEILESGDGAGWDEAEVRWIAYFRTLGYRLTNATDGGGGSPNPSPETRARMSAAQRGKKVPREVVEKIQRSRAGYRHSEETRVLISLSLRGVKKPPLSEDHKDKIRRASVGRGRSERYIAERTRVALAILGDFRPELPDCVSALARKYGVSASMVRRVVSGRHPYLAGVQTPHRDTSKYTKAPVGDEVSKLSHLPAPEIAGILGVSTTTVYRWARKLGISLPPAPTPHRWTKDNCPNGK